MVDVAQVQAVSDALLEEGAFAIDIADAHAGTEHESPIFGEPGVERESAFRSNRVIALFEAATDLSQSFERAMAAAGAACTQQPIISEIEEQDWVRLTQSQFSPIRISARLWIVPSWCVGPHDPSAISITLDPGLAFGTGTHPTTRLCLEWLDQHMMPGRSVIDYGCGSGILAIAAAKLGAASVKGFDIDMQAVSASRYNAERNGVIATFLQVDEPNPPPADVVMANIISNPLKALAPLLAKLTAPGGTLILSGILSSQTADVMHAYRPWFDFEEPVFDEGWVRLGGTRRLN